MSGPEIVLTFEDSRWRARGCGVDVVHADLRDVDAAIVEAFAAADRRVDVQVRFDHDALPEWLRQYHTHYCNYSLRIAPRSAAR